MVFLGLVLWMCLLHPGTSFSQTIQGTWEGFVLQEDSQDTFYYQIKVSQNGPAITGTSISRSPDGTAEVQFELSGFVEEGKVVLQEINQLSPPSPLWCKKYAEMVFTVVEGKPQLNGNWKATGCTPGLISLTSRDIVLQETSLEAARIGKWVGYLTQSDREYGFFFDMTLEEGGRGVSHIISEGGGGFARHELEWTWLDYEQVIEVKELKVIERGIDGWPWCIKNVRLKFEQIGDKMQLKGDWSGRIENTTNQKGICAPGTIFLEKLIPPPTMVYIDRPEEPAAPSDPPPLEVEGRKVDIQRIMDVRSNQIKIKMWDNGVVDGDILTVYLNGEKLVEKLRLTKRKQALIVKLKDKENILVIHADDLGNLPPNTVAMSVDDGEEEQILLLTSNLKESGAVLIRKFSYRGE